MVVFLLKNDGEHDDDDKNDLEEREEVVRADDDDAEEVSLEMIVFSISRFNDCVIKPWDRLILSSSLRLKSVVEYKKSNQHAEKKFWRLHLVF